MQPIENPHVVFHSLFTLLMHVILVHWLQVPSSYFCETLWSSEKRNELRDIRPQAGKSGTTCLKRISDQGSVPTMPLTSQVKSQSSRNLRFPSVKLIGK